jgi:hypothetical protein
LTHSPHREFPSNTLHNEGSRERQREQARGIRIPRRAVRSESKTRCSVALDLGTLGMVKEEEESNDSHLSGRGIAGYLSDGTPPRINLRAEGLEGGASVTNTVTEIPEVLAFEECSKQVRLITAERTTGPRGVRHGRVGVLDSPTETTHWWKVT